jgi:hypothetical protein
MAVLKQSDAGPVELQSAFAAAAGALARALWTDVSFAQLSNLQTKSGIKQKLAQA